MGFFSGAIGQAIDYFNPSQASSGGLTPNTLPQGAVVNNTGQVTGYQSPSDFIGPYQLGPTGYAEPGTTTNNPAPAPTQAPSGGSTGGTNVDPHINPATGLWDDNYYQSQLKSSSGYQDQQRATINSGWDSYVNQLNSMLGDIGTTKQSQENLALGNVQTGLNEAGIQKAAGERQVSEQQARNLRDLGANVKNLFQSGNVYLGSRGAGDSSAANQYSYAISQMGTKARGDIMSQANSRLQQIGDIYNSEKNRLESEKNTRLAQISDWFSQAQQQIKGQIGQAGLGRSQDLQNLSATIYNQALTAMQTLQAQQQQRSQALETWALNNSKTVQEAIKNIQTVGQSLPQFNGLNSGMPQVTSQGNMFVPVGYGTGEEKKGLFQ